jgi:hypothetical protein
MARISLDASLVAVVLVTARISLDSSVLARASLVTAQIILHDYSMGAVAHYYCNTARISKFDDDSVGAVASTHSSQHGYHAIQP